MDFKKNNGYRVIQEWLKKNDRKPFLFQEETWRKIHAGKSGLVNAPTGSGKTFSVFLGTLIRYIDLHPDHATRKNNGLQLLWITPLRALGKDIGRAMENVIEELNLPWKIGIRNGDTSVTVRQQQKRNMPEVMIITPESLQLLLAQKGYPDLFKNLLVLAVDEWHELLGSKRGVQVELSISRIIHSQLAQSKSCCSVWGISATIGNLAEAKEVLLAPLLRSCNPENIDAGIVHSKQQKKLLVHAIFPDEIEKYPWAGHLGLKLSDKLLPLIYRNKSTLIFINTRGMSERWYQELLRIDPGLSGALALHHGSIEPELRMWVEDALHAGTLQAVVCTSSLDLGVDFRPVDMVVQVGSPKGVARFLQRAGRSGHQPGAASQIYFLPTHSLELMEVAALKEAISLSLIESRPPFMLCFDVLLQYMCTLAISEGFYPDQLLKEIRTTHCYADITDDEWLQLLQFITAGGVALQQYDEFKKVEIREDGLYQISNRRMAMRHRMHIGTIVSDAMMKVKFIAGGFIGVIEEWFISRLNPGDVFTLAGRNLEFVMIKDMTALVRKSSSKKSIVPSWMGGRLPLSANLGFMLRKKLDDVSRQESDTFTKDKELHVLKPLFDLQKQLSAIPKENELLIEHIETKDGFHLFVYPFEGRLVHEAMAALLAYRLSRKMPISFSFAMNDYGFELLSDQPIPLDDSNVYDLFSEENLLNDIRLSVNASEMARRKFRDIAVIGGLIFQGMPGEKVKQKHLQSSASLLFNVFSEYEPANLLLRQAYQEVMEQQMDEARLRSMLQRIQAGKVIIQFPPRLTPFCFPIKVDSMREQLSSEQLEDRVRKMKEQLEKNNG